MQNMVGGSGYCDITSNGRAHSHSNTVCVIIIPTATLYVSSSFPQQHCMCHHHSHSNTVCDIIIPTVTLYVSSSFPQ